MATQIRKKNIYFLLEGSLVTPIHACSHVGTARYPQEKFPICESLIISLYSIVQVATVSFQIAPLQNGDRAVGANYVRREHIPPNLAQTSKNGKEYKNRKIRYSNPEQGLFPEFQFRRCQVNPWGSPNINFSPLQVGGRGAL